MIDLVRDRFYLLATKERKQLLFIVFCTIIGSYGFAASLLWEEMFQAEKMANRKENRIKVHLGGFKTPDIDTSYSQAGFDAKQQQLASLERQLIRYSAKLMPLDTPQPQEKIKLALARMAAKNGIAITSLTSSHAEIVTMPAILAGPELRYLLQNRPVFQVSCQGNYHAFVRFTEQLKQLPYYHLIRNLSIQPSSVVADSGVTHNGYLTITFDLQM